MNDQQKSAVAKSSNWAISFLYLLVLLFLFWSCFRGFDWTDESYYLLSYRYPEDVTKGVTLFHIYLGYIFNLLGYNVVLLRIVGIIFLQLSSLVFCFGFFKIAEPRFNKGDRHGRFSSLSDCSFIGIGTLLAYSWYLPTPSYNSLNAIFINAGTGLYFFGIGHLQNLSMNRHYSKVLFFFSGVLVGGCILTKFTSGMALLCLLLFFSTVWSGLFASQKYHISLFFVAGIFFWILTHSFFIGNFTDWVDFASKGIDLFSTLGSNHGISSIPRYLMELRELVIASFVSFWLLYLCIFSLGGFFLIQKNLKGKATEKYYFAFLVIVLFGIAVSFYRGQYLGGITRFNHLAKFYLSLMMLLSAILVVIALLDYKTYSLGNNKSRTIILLAVAFGLPFVGTFGTGNQIYGIVPYYITPWFGIFLLLFRKLESLFNLKTIKYFFMLSISCFAATQIISGCLIYPYRLNSGILEQVVETKIGSPASVLRIDEQSSQFVKELRQISEKNGFKPGDDMLVFYNLPGAVFCLGGRSPGVPWYFGSYEKGFKRFAEKALSDVPVSRIRNAFLLQNSSDISRMPDLKVFGIDFPEDYSLCGQLDSPYRESTEKYLLWKPKIKQAWNSPPV